QLTALLGDPRADPDTPEGRRARFTNLGAIGPDMLYALLDYGEVVQEFEDFLVKTAGTFQCISELSEAISNAIDDTANAFTGGLWDSFKETSDLIGGI